MFKERYKLRSDLQVIPFKDRLHFSTDSGNFSMKGSPEIVPVLGNIVPLINGENSVKDICDKLPEIEDDIILSILENLYENNILEKGTNKTEKKNQVTSSPKITFIGHATVLIDTCGLNIITDPWIFVRNKKIDTPPFPITFEDLPPLDVICITHIHIDHLNPRTLIRLDKSIPVVVPKIASPSKRNEDIKLLLRDLGFKNIISLQLWESYKLRDFKITRTPCHNAFGVTEQCTWLIESPEISVFCGGDMLEDEPFMRN